MAERAVIVLFGGIALTIVLIALSLTGLLDWVIAIGLTSVTIPVTGLLYNHFSKQVDKPSIPELKEPEGEEIECEDCAEIFKPDIRKRAGDLLEPDVVEYAICPNCGAENVLQPGDNEE